MKVKSSSLKLALVLCLSLIGITACDRRTANLPERERTAGEEMDDKALSDNVRAALNGDSVKCPDIQVAAYRGVVQLSGFVDTKDHKGRAADIAKNVAGVRRVDNNITVKEERKP